jgi:hypothetical protein
MSDFIPTAEEFAIAMQDAAGTDLENAHSEMDELMVNLLRMLGYDKAMDIFEAQQKWYA